MNFEDLGLQPRLVKSVNEKGYTEPTPIQAKAIPVILEGKDIMAAAQTGTGKTAGFTLPVLQRLKGHSRPGPRDVHCLILVPTRELAAQVSDSVLEYGKGLNLNTAVVFGGVNIRPQLRKLERGVDVLIATPGRLLDISNQGGIRFDSLQILVLDEADRMLDMGFIPDIRRIVGMLPKRRQTLMFSATFSDEIKTLAAQFLSNPVSVSVTPPNSTVDRIEQRVYPVDKSKKIQLLTHLIQENNWQQVLVFCRTKHGSDKVARQLNAAGISSDAIHGNKSQNNRTRALAAFKKGAVQVLVATDIAARGIDISQLPQVVNLELPDVPEDYVHRIGRTGRAGAVGCAHSLVCADEVAKLQRIERLTRQTIPREEIEGFEPDHQLPTKSLAAAEPRRSNNASRGRKPGSSNNASRRGGAEGRVSNARGNSEGRDGDNRRGDGENQKSGQQRRPQRANPNSRGSDTRGDRPLAKRTGDNRARVNG